MNDVLGHNSALVGYTRPGTTWANEMNFVMNPAPGVGSIARPVDHYICWLRTIIATVPLIIFPLLKRKNIYSKPFYHANIILRLPCEHWK